MAADILFVALQRAFSSLFGAWYLMFLSGGMHLWLRENRGEQVDIKSRGRERVILFMKAFKYLYAWNRMLVTISQMIDFQKRVIQNAFRITIMTSPSYAWEYKRVTAVLGS